MFSPQAKWKMAKCSGELTDVLSGSLVSGMVSVGFAGGVLHNDSVDP